MLKGIQSNDDVRKFLCRRFKGTSILNSCSKRLLSCYLEGIRTYINTDHAFCPSSSHLHGVSSFAAAKVDDNLPYDIIEEILSQ